MLDPKEFVRSICHGRARIRHASLRGLSPEEVESLTTMIAGFDGITSVKLNPRVGSLLVTWDETKTNAESLLAAAQFFLPDEPAAEEAAEVFEGAQDQDAQPEAAKPPLLRRRLPCRAPRQTRSRSRQPRQKRGSSGARPSRSGRRP